MGRTNMLKLSAEQKVEFTAKLQALCTEFGVTIGTEDYCDTPFLMVTDAEGNWNVLTDAGNGMEIQDTDFFEID